jgi:hypothetical protein
MLPSTSSSAPIQSSRPFTGTIFPPSKRPSGTRSCPSAYLRATPAGTAASPACPTPRPPLSGADTMLQFAQMGWCGFNLHGGGNGYYTPIAGSPSTGLRKRPEYFGIEFAQLFTGATFLSTTLIGASPCITAYAFQRDQRRLLALFNKDVNPITMTLPVRPQPHAQLLTGPSLESKEGISLSTTNVPRSQTVSVPAQSAILYTFG